MRGPSCSGNGATPSRKRDGARLSVGRDPLREVECPFCDSAYSLERVQTRTHETITAVCTCCGKQVVIKDGQIVPDARDTQGNIIRDDP